MNAWTSGYIHDIDYTHGFYRELTPSLLTLAALCAGQKLTAFEGPVRYCELGCGQGFSTNLLAAANPHIDFYANDFNPAHIAGARLLAAQSKLTNVRFYEASFADFADEPSLPPTFDIIVLHGVLSWVPASARRELLDFVARKLRPGGLVYVSYNTLPGWAPILPLRRILVDRASQGSGALVPRIDDAIEFAETLEAAEAAYFKYNPSARRRLEQLSPMARNYLAHEFFNRDWEPFYFSDVTTELGHVKLSFAASVNLLRQAEDFAMSDAQKRLLDGETDALRRESVRDILVNTQFRTDLFVKGPIAHSFRSSAATWLDIRFVLTSSTDAVIEGARQRAGKPDLEPYRSMLTAFEHAPTTIKELLTTGKVQGTTWEQLTQTIILLVGAGYLQPCLREEGLAERIESCRQFNSAVCEMARDCDDMHHLASPITGGGLSLTRFEQLFLIAAGEGRGEEEWPQFAWSVLKPQGYRLTDGGRVLEGEEENLRKLRDYAVSFASGGYLICNKIGISL